jgi:LPXTG-motif cell wall-anchored protein
VKRLLRLTLGLVTAAIITLGFSSAASAQTTIIINCYTGATCITNITLNTFIVAPGGRLVIEGSAFMPDSPVTVTVASTPTVVGTPITDAEGNFSLAFNAPTELGDHTVTASDGTNTLVLGFTVVAADAVDAAGTLPYTGSNSSVPVAQIGAGLVAAGAVLVLMVRKRQHHLASVKVDA